jgi:hypothetical protein
MDELINIMVDLLNHKDEHKTSYKENKRSNREIVTAWVNVHKDTKKYLDLFSVSKTLLAEKFNDGYIKGCEDTEANYNMNT